MASKAVKEVDTKEEETKPEAEPEAKSKGLMARGSNQDKEGVV